MFITDDPILYNQFYEHQEADPSKIKLGSNKKYLWKCSTCSYIWPAPVNRKNNGAGCPVCAGRKVKPGYNDLATTNPDLAEEWHPEKNNLTPKEVSKGQMIKVWWKCKLCGNDWQARINDRKEGKACPNCFRRSSFPETAIYYYIKKHIAMPVITKNKQY